MASQQGFNHKVPSAVKRAGIVDGHLRCFGLNRNAGGILARSCEAVSQPTERQRIGDQIDAALVTARADLVKVDH
jgi:hypothetical protein